MAGGCYSCDINDMLIENQPAGKGSISLPVSVHVSKVSHNNTKRSTDVSSASLINNQ